MSKIEHVTIAVQNLKTAIEDYKKILQCDHSKPELNMDLGVESVNFITKTINLKLIAPYGDSGMLNKHIQNRGEGIHHIALEVEDIYSEIERLKMEGYHFLDDTPVFGTDDKLICFMEPKDSHGVLLKLCERLRQ